MTISLDFIAWAVLRIVVFTIENTRKDNERSDPFPWQGVPTSSMDDYLKRLPDITPCILTDTIAG